MSNLESQENEIFSLQSIFDNEEFSVDNMDPPKGQIIANVRLPDNFCVKVNQKDNQKQDSIIPDEIFHVDHLPPLSLFFEFPPTYPLETCPAFLLSCNWLSIAKLSLLCKHLQFIWETNKDAILFNWMQFLQEETLGFLSISQCLDISELLDFKIKDNLPHKGNKRDIMANIEDSNLMTLSAKLSIYGGNGLYDSRAFVDLSDGVLLRNILQDYNEQKNGNVFSASMQECDVCLLRKLGSDFIKFNSCKHFFCKACVKEYFEALIKEGSVSYLKCLQGECDAQLDGTTVRTLVGPELYERYDKLLLSTTLDSMTDISYCPRKECQCACIIDTCGRMGTCSACGFVFCPFCKMTYHGVAQCNLKSQQRMAIYEEYTNGDSTVKERLEKRYGKRAVQALVEDTLSEGWKSSNSKSCPSCHTSIEKTMGCHKISCFKCGTHFCWLCVKVLPQKDPYFHFRDPTTTCFNMLFPEEERGEFNFYQF